MQRPARRELNIDDNNPWNSDLFDRKTLADNLLEVINTYDKPLTLSVNGSWGTGKTQFVKMWGKDLKLKGYQTIYFNAWEHDFSQNPLMAFIYELLKDHKEINKDIKDKKDKLKKATIAASKTILKNSLYNLAKTVTAGTLDKESVNQLGKNFTQKPGSHDLENSDPFTQISQDIQNMKDLKDFFSQYINAYTNNDGKPMMIFIDELDRCKPSWAINLLEAIKHLFSESGNAVFIVSTDREQLGNSIAGLYGPSFDGQNYLRRIFDFDFTLPEPNIKKYVRMHWNEIKEPGNPQAVLTGKETNECIDFISELLEKLKFTLRDADQFFIKIHHFISTLKNNRIQIGTTCFDIFAIALLYKNESIAHQLFNLKNRNQTLDHIASHTDLNLQHPFWKPISSNPLMYIRYDQIYLGKNTKHDKENYKHDRSHLSQEQNRANQQIYDLLCQTNIDTPEISQKNWLKKIYFASENLGLV